MAAYLEASIDKVPFKVSTADIEAGRRTVLTEFPLRDIPYVEDIGRRSRVFTVDGFVLGDDWLAQADALITISEKPGPKLLVHPVFGNLTVSITEPIRMQYTMSIQREARFSLVCVQTGTENLDLARGAAVVTQQQVRDFVPQVHEKVTEDLTAPRFAGSNVKLFTAQQTYAYGLQTTQQKALARWRRMLRNIRGMIENFTSPVTGFIESVQTVVTAINDLDAALGNTVTDAEQILLAVGGIFHDVGQLASGNLAVVQACDYFFTTIKGANAEGAEVVDAVKDWFGIDTEIGTDNSAVANNANADSEARFALVGMATIYADAVVTAPWEDTGTVDKYSERFGAAVEMAATGMADTGNDASYHALDEMRRLAVEYMDSISPTLREVDTVTLPSGPITALALSYSLYDDVEQEADLIAKNPGLIRDPGFLPLNEPISFLSA